MIKKKLNSSDRIFHFHKNAAWILDFVNVKRKCHKVFKSYIGTVARQSLFTDSLMYNCRYLPLVFRFLLSFYETFSEIQPPLQALIVFSLKAQRNTWLTHRMFKVNLTKCSSFSVVIQMEKNTNAYKLHNKKALRLCICLRSLLHRLLFVTSHIACVCLILSWIWSSSLAFETTRITRRLALVFLCSGNRFSSPFLLTFWSHFLGDVMHQENSAYATSQSCLWKTIRTPRALRLWLRYSTI